MVMLTDLDAVVRRSGLIVVEVDGWQTRGRPGAFDPIGVLCHHTGSYDGIADTSSDLAYARWLATVGRPDLSAPLCQLALAAESVVFVIAAGRANHAGVARASGPIPAGDGNTMLVGIEAMNSGEQGWDTLGVDAAGDPVTQAEGYARLCAALCAGYSWPAAAVRGHRETSTTGKWDPGLLDLDAHRADVARWITTLTTPEDPMADYAAQLDEISTKLDDVLERLAVLERARGKTLDRDRALAKKLRELSAQVRAGDRTVGAKLDQVLAELEADQR